MLNSISRLGETRPEQEWPNGTEFSGYSDFSKISEWNFGRCLFHSLPLPEFPEFLVEWKAPCIFSCYDPISDCEVGFVPGFFPLLKGDGLIRSVTPWLLASRVLTLRMRCLIPVAPSLCPKGTFLKTGLYCVPDCGPGSYGHTLTNTCQKCSSKCRTCRNGALDDLCTSCNNPFYLRGIRLCF